MKLSIWQQFSSNHSNSFTVVGTFAEIAATEAASRKLHDLLEQIHYQGIGYYERAPLQAEINAGRDYELDWTEHLDWLEGYNYEEFVIRLDNTIFLGPMRGDATWQGALMLDTLVARMGAQTVIKEEEMSNHSIAAYVHAEAPDEETAQRLYDLVARYVEELHIYWADASGNGKFPEAPWVQHHPVTAAPLDGPLLRKFDVDFSVAIEPDELIFEPKLALQRASLSFENLHFGHYLGYGLPAFVRWLRVEGCIVTFKCRVRDHSE